MKAIIYRSSGASEAYTCEEIEAPRVRDHEVVLKVHAAAVNPLDLSLRAPSPNTRTSAKQSNAKGERLGRDVAGEVAAVGKNVRQFKIGDAVFGACRDAFAEYACASESSLAMKPENVTFEQAAAVPVAGLTALQGLRDKARLRAGQKVLINGAAGGVGTFAVQIAKSLGAEVTGVCSTRNVEMVRAIGADHVIDYTQENFTESGQRYDVIFDCAGNHPLSAHRRVLSAKGVCVLVGALNTPNKLWAMLRRIFTGLVLSRFVSQSFVAFIAKMRKEDLNVLRELLASGKLAPVIDRRYGLHETPAAMRYLREGHAAGKVVITLKV
jgi:NADPH:quinone reductase-like Zn-dependent oxidoreductase